MPSYYYRVVGPLSHCTWYRASNQVQYRTSIELCTELGKKTSLGAQFSTEPKCCTVRSLGAVGWTSSGLAEGAEGLRLGLLLLLLLAQVTAPGGCEGTGEYRVIWEYRRMCARVKQGILYIISFLKVIY